MAYNANNVTEEEILVIPKNNRGDHIIVKKVTNKSNGAVSADVRNFYTADDDSLRPGKGIRLNSENLPEVMAAMAQCMETDEIEDLKEKLDALLDEREVDTSDMPE